MNINRANELFEKYSSDLPDYVMVTQSSIDAFKITVSRLGTSQIEFQPKKENVMRSTDD